MKEVAGSVAVRVAGPAAAPAGRRAQVAEVSCLPAGAVTGGHRHHPLYLPVGALGARHLGSIADQQLEIGPAGRAVIVVDGHGRKIACA